MIKWNNFFDHIYCINYTLYKERHDFMQKEFDRIGINTKDDYFSWLYTIDSPFFTQLLDSPTFKKEENNIWWNWKAYPKGTLLLKCSLAHYQCLKDAQVNQYKRILILEDDEIFLKDIDEIEKYLLNIPSDFDIILYDKALVSKKSIYDDIINDSTCKYNDYYMRYGLHSEYFVSSAFYALSDSYINYMIDSYENLMCPSDHYLNKISDNDSFNRYFSSINIGVQREYSNKINLDSYWNCGYYSKMDLKKEWYNY